MPQLVSAHLIFKAGPNTPHSTHLASVFKSKSHAAQPNCYSATHLSKTSLLIHHARLVRILDARFVVCWQVRCRTLKAWSGFTSNAALTASVSPLYGLTTTRSAAPPELLFAHSQRTYASPTSARGRLRVCVCLCKRANVLSVLARVLYEPPTRNAFSHVNA